MRMRISLFSLLALGLSVAPAAAQEAGALPPPPVKPAARAPGDPVAKVNDQVIVESAVRRCFRVQHVPPAREAEARPPIVDFLIDTALVDQYLAQLKVETDKKEVDSRVEQLYADIKKSDQKVEDFLKELNFTEAEFRGQVEALVRWDKFVNDQGTDEKLKKFFEANRETFDGTQVRARHILLAPSSADPKATEAAIAKLQQFKKEAEEAGNAAVAKLPANADAFTKKKMYNDSMDAAFAELARQNSVCGSKKAGGDLMWFNRVHDMIEPFSQAAFALEPYHMSDVVKTQLGYHLILVTDRRAGHEVKFDDVKQKVKEVYGDRLREAVLAAMRPRAKIEIVPTTKAGE
jgi:peptidyl-prolyl cis-trans isomerase C